MINLQITGVYDMGLKGRNAGFAIVMKDPFGNSYQTNLATSQNYTDQVKKSFQRLKPLRLSAAIDLSGLFTTA